MLSVYDSDNVLVGGARDSLQFSQKVLENSSLKLKVQKLLSVQLCSFGNELTS